MLLTNSHLCIAKSMILVILIETLPYSQDFKLVTLNCLCYDF